MTEILIPETLINLKRLYLTRNQLTHILIPCLPELEAIFVAHNQLHTFSIEGPLFELYWLRLNDNPQLTTLPESLDESPKLWRIDITNTQIDENLRNKILASSEKKRLRSGS